MYYIAIFSKVIGPDHQTLIIFILSIMIRARFNSKNVFPFCYRWDNIIFHLHKAKNLKLIDRFQNSRAFQLSYLLEFSCKNVVGRHRLRLRQGR